MAPSADTLIAATVVSVAALGAAAAAWLIGRQRRDDELREQRMLQMLQMVTQATQGGGANHTHAASTATPLADRSMRNEVTHAYPVSHQSDSPSYAARQDQATRMPRAHNLRVHPPKGQGLMPRRTPSLELSHFVPSMEDVVKEHEAEGQRVMELSPQNVLEGLQEGNNRFWMGAATRPELSAMERRAMIMRQFPKVAILGCSDSRVPIEIVFDQGLGDVFAIRVAGNAYGTGAAASIDYAVQHLKVKVVMVLGHEGCGAVRAAQLTDEELRNEPDALKGWLTAMKQSMGTQALSSITDARARDREAVMSNVRAQLEQLGRNALIQSKVRAGELLVVGAFYEISSGMVDFMEPMALCGDAAA